MLKKTYHLLNSVLKFLLVFAMVLMIVVVTVQIVARLSFPSPPPWTEEAARIFFVYMVSIGGALAIKEKEYVNVDTFLSMFSPKWQTFLTVFIYLSIIFVMIFMAIHSIRFIQLGNIQTSPSLQLPMSYVFASMLLLPALVIVYTSIEIFYLVKSILKDQL